MSATFDPITVCKTCGGSTHATRFNLTAHANRCHAPMSNPEAARFEWPTEDAIVSAGWTRDDFTHWPYGAASALAWMTASDFTIRPA